MTNAHLNTALADELVMKAHRERYRGWTMVVEISGDSRGEDVSTGRSHYVPRIVVTEQLSIGFRELAVPTNHGYATPKQCFQGGIQIARQFIDGRI